MDSELLKIKLKNELKMFIGKPNSTILRKMIAGKVERLLKKLEGGDTIP